MNLDNVKYPWLLVKFKDNQAIEVVSGNASILPEIKLQKALPIMQRHLQETKRNARHNKEAGK